MQWAEFKDPNGDINDANNYIHGSLQSDKPDKHQIGDYWTLNHPNWRQVADSYTPPEPIKTAEQLLSEARSSSLSKIDTELAKTDYKCWEFADGYITAEAYEHVKDRRNSLRDAYNAVETATSISDINTIMSLLQ